MFTTDPVLMTNEHAYRREQLMRAAGTWLQRRRPVRATRADRPRAMRAHQPGATRQEAPVSTQDVSPSTQDVPASTGAQGEAAAVCR